LAGLIAGRHARRSPGVAAEVTTIGQPVSSRASHREVEVKSVG
jgi:hypothetical protein